MRFFLSSRQAKCRVWVLEYLGGNTQLLLKKMQLSLVSREMQRSGSGSIYVEGAKEYVLDSGVARTWVMPGPSSWSLPVERRIVAISPREARKIFSHSFFSYQDGLLWHLHALYWCTRIYVVFASHAPNYMHALTATDQGLRTRRPRVRGRA